MTIETDKSRAIPTEEVRRDLADTEREIDLYERELVAFEAVPYDSPDYRMAQFRASHRRQGIADRRVVADKLRTLLAEREACTACDGVGEVLLFTGNAPCPECLTPRDE